MERGPASPWTNSGAHQLQKLFRPHSISVLDRRNPNPPRTRHRMHTTPSTLLLNLLTLGIPLLASMTPFSMASNPAQLAHPLSTQNPSLPHSGRRLLKPSAREQSQAVQVSTIFLTKQAQAKTNQNQPNPEVSNPPQKEVEILPQSGNAPGGSQRASPSKGYGTAPNAEDDKTKRNKSGSAGVTPPKEMEKEEGFNVTVSGYSDSTSMVNWPGINTLAHPIAYHGGPLLKGTVPIHFLYYGNWSGNFGHGVMDNFVKSAMINSLDTAKGIPTVHQWWRSASFDPIPKVDLGARPKINLKLGAKVVVNRGYNRVLRDGFQGRPDDILSVIQQQITGKAIPSDPNAIYVVITGNDVKVGDSNFGFCSVYCGWHKKFQPKKGPAIHYAFIGDSTSQCNANCGQNLGFKVSPNGFYRIDSLMSTFAHEIVETVTNPDGQTGWWALSADKRTGFENADLCNGIFSDLGNPKPSFGPGRAYQYNVLGVQNSKFLLQASASILTQRCVLR